MPYLRDAERGGPILRFVRGLCGCQTQFLIYNKMRMRMLTAVKVTNGELSTTRNFLYREELVAGDGDGVDFCFGGRNKILIPSVDWGDVLKYYQITNACIRMMLKWIE